MNKLTWKDIWGNKYHKKYFIRMVSLGCTIAAIMIVLNLTGKAYNFKLAALIVQLVFYCVYGYFYWNRLEVMEQQEKIIQGGNNGPN